MLMLGLSLATVHAAPLKPVHRFETAAMVSDLELDGNILYVATQKGTVELFDLESKARVGQISLPNVVDFLGDAIAPKVFSVDRQDGWTLIVSTGRGGYSDIYLEDAQKQLQKVIDAEQDQLMVKEARFIAGGRLLLGLLSNELVLYDLAVKRAVYRVQASLSAFSDMALNETRTEAVTTDESGEVHRFDVQTGKETALLSGQNVDNVYMVDLKKGSVITAGQDRRCAVYGADGSRYYLNSDFLIYAAALSPAARTGVFSSGIDNDLQLFDVGTGTPRALLHGHGATVTDLLFVGEERLLSAAEEKTVLLWEIPQEKRK